MLKLVSLLIFFGIYASAMAAEEKNILDFDAEERNVDIKKTNTWNMGLSVMGMQYQPNFTFNTSQAKFGESFNKDKLIAIGTMIEFGRDYYLTDRFLAATKIQSFYGRASNSTNTVADPTIDVSVASLNQELETYGTGISQMLGYNFETGSMMIRPFVEYAIGVGKGSTHLKYNYDISGTDDGQENYDMRIRDTFVYNSLSLGVSFVSNKGISSIIKLSQVGFASGKTLLTGTEKKPAQAINIKSNQEVELASSANLSLLIGLGYYF